MTVNTLPEQSIRVPTLPIGRMVDKEGMPTDDELLFRTQLITSLQNNFNYEGLVMPTQQNGASPQDYVTQIQNHQNIKGQYTCALGTMVYVIVDPNDYTQDKVMIAVRNSNDYPESAPLFKTVTLT